MKGSNWHLLLYKNRKNYNKNFGFRTESLKAKQPNTFGF